VVICLLAANHKSNCSLTQAMDANQLPLSTLQSASGH